MLHAFSQQYVFFFNLAVHHLMVAEKQCGVFDESLCMLTLFKSVKVLRL